MHQPLSRQICISNELGLHLRAAGVLAQVANQFQSDIWLEQNGNKVDGKSIMSVLSLAAKKGSTIRITVHGADAMKALRAVISIIENNFDQP